MKNKKMWLLALLAAAGSAHAQTLTLEAAITHALRHNPDLAAVQSQSAAASSARAAAEGARLPQLDLNYLARRSDNPLDAFADKLNTRSVNPATDFTASALNQPSASTLHATELALSWPLYTGGRLSALAGEAGEQENAARLQYRRARELTAFRAHQAWHSAQTMEEGMKVTAEAVRAAERHADTTARLLRERRIVASDNLTAEVNLSMWRSLHEQAVSRARSARNQLALATGDAAHATAGLPAWNDLAPAAPAAAPMQAMEIHERRALEQRADLQAQEAVVRAARNRIEQARAGYLPQVNLIASESWYDDRVGLDNSSTRVMGLVSLNLWRGGRDQGQVSAAAELAGQQERRLEALRQQVRAEVRNSYQALAEARARVEICADNIGKAQRTVELVQGRYGEGRTILIDLLQAERALVEARQEKLAAQLAYAVAEAALRLADGTLATPE